MKVAVIDSGISIEDSLFDENNIEVINIVNNVQENIDLCGHGTLSAGEIIYINHNAKLVNIRVLNSEGICKLSELIKALEYCIYDKEIKLINIGLSCYIDDYEVVSLFEDIVNKLYQNNQLIISAVPNDGEDGYPSKFQNVISVEYKYITDNREYYKFDRKKLCCTYYSPLRLLPEVNGYTFFSGNSCATAKMTGRISLMLESGKTMNSLLDCIKNNEDTDYADGFLYKNKLHMKKRKLIKIIRSILMDDDIKRIDSKYILEFMQPQLYVNILKNIDELYKIHLDYTEFTSHDFQGIKQLLKKINYNHLKEDI